MEVRINGRDLSEYIEAADIASRLNKTRETVWRLCRAGEIPGAVQLGTQWFIPAESAESPALLRANGRPRKVS